MSNINSNIKKKNSVIYIIVLSVADEQRTQKLLKMKFQI